MGVSRKYVEQCLNYDSSFIGERCSRHRCDVVGKSEVSRLTKCFCGHLWPSVYLFLFLKTKTKNKVKRKSKC